MEKRYYWIKLHTNFFNEDKIDFLMSQKNGAQYVVLYQMLCLKTVNSNGSLSNNVGDILVPYDIQKIVRDCKYFNQDTVIVAMELYKKLGLIFETENQILQIANYDDVVGSESKSAKRVRDYRQRHKALHCNKNVTQEIELEKELEKELLVGNNKNNNYLEITNKTRARASESVENLKIKFEKMLELYKSSEFEDVFNEVLEAFSWIVETAPKKFNGRIYNKKELQDILNNLSEDRLLNIVKTVKYSEDIQDRELYFLGCFINSK